MASNLRARLPASDTLLVNDYIPEVADKFVSEIRSSESDIAEGAKKVEAFRTPKEVAQKSVSKRPECCYSFGTSTGCLYRRVPS